LLLTSLFNLFDKSCNSLLISPVWAGPKRIPILPFLNLGTDLLMNHKIKSKNDWFKFAKV
jgi:hypothetical protein